MASLPVIPAKLHGHGILPDSSETQIKLPTQETRRKRVYETVALLEAGGDFGVSLDGRQLHTPLKSKLATSSRALAEAICDEWDSQGDFIDPGSMPLTKLLNTATDRIQPDPTTVIAGVLGYFDTDLLCYRAAKPAALVALQSSVWQPVLDWLRETHNIDLVVGTGLMPLTHDAAAHSRAEALMMNCTVAKLTGVQAVAGLTSSLSLGFALIEENLSGAEVAAAATLDETWQMEHWGEDLEALDRIALLASDVLAVERFLKLSE